MHKLLSILKQSENFLKQKGISNALFNAEVLFAHALNCKRIDLYLRYNQELKEDQLAKIRVLLSQRAHHEPLQYIVGSWPFYEVLLYVDKRALIPRPETEYLVELLVKRLSKKEYQSLNVLDLGTGTGAIALSLAKKFPKAQVTAVDQSQDALSLAQENAKRNKINNVTFVTSNWYSSINDNFDLIVSNPPYLTEAEWENTQLEIKNFEPKVALVADNEGNADLIHIIENADKFLKHDGTLALETGDTQHEHLLQIAKKWFSSYKSVKDQFGKDRFLFLHKQ